MDGKKANTQGTDKTGTAVSVLKNFVSNLKNQNLHEEKKLLALILAVLAFAVIVSVVAVKCSSSKDASQNKADESTVVLDDNTAEGNSTGQINTENDEALSISPEKTGSTENKVNSDNEMTSQNEVPPDTQENSAQTDSLLGVGSNSYTLYCGKFSSEKSAEEKKASIAISTGLSSKIIPKNSFYSVLLGPFNTREEAVNTFNRLDSLKLIDECELEEKN